MCSLRKRRQSSSVFRFCVSDSDVVLAEMTRPYSICFGLAAVSPVTGACCLEKLALPRDKCLDYITGLSVTDT